jgi:hypothetical protein
MIRIFSDIIVGFIASAACETVRSAQYSIPRIRDVEARTGAPVLIGAFIDCRSHAPDKGPAFVLGRRRTAERSAWTECYRVLAGKTKAAAAVELERAASTAPVD